MSSYFFFFFKQKTAYEMRISDWSSDVCSSDLLAADATNPHAVARIYAAKGRPSFNPLIVHVPAVATAETIGVFDADARALAGSFWPGPLTRVVPLRPDAGIASLVTAGLDTIALRVPRPRAMQALIARSEEHTSALQVLMRIS